MTTNTLNQGAPAMPRRKTPSTGSTFSLWRQNIELFLAAITLIALLIGWLGGAEMSGLLPQWAIWLAAVTAFSAGGYSGVKGAIAEARMGKLDIDFLMITAALGAALIGAWEEGALLLFLFTLSGALEEFAMDRTRAAIAGLTDLRPDVADVRRNGQEISVPVEELRVHDIVVVKPGDRLPVDGVVRKGTTSVDQSPITGESVPVRKAPGDDVFAGTINGGGALDVEVTRLASESTLSKIIQLVAEAQKDAAPTQQIIDRFSQPYTLAVIGSTLLTILIPWLFINEPFSDTLYRAMTLLVVASPCALIISTPASILSAIAAAARGGVLFKGGAYLEKMAEITVIAFDKTGTLTYGKPVVTDVWPLTNYTAQDVVRIAAGAELRSEHPLGRAILRKAEEMGITPEEPHDFQSIPGHGLQASYDRGDHMEIVYIGNDRLFLSTEMDLSPAVRLIGQKLQRQGKTAMLVVRKSTVEDTLGSRDWEAVGYLAVADTLRPGAAETLQALRDQGIKQLIMLTGDNKEVAESIARQVGVDMVYSDLLPEQKLEKIKELIKTEQIAMIGDGVNDAPALATATVGIAMGAAGTDVAMETADIVLMADDLTKLPFTIRLSRQAERIVRQNIIFSISVIVSLILLTLVVPIFVPDFVLPLPFGVIGHEGSTLIVVLNGLRMLAIQPPQIAN